MNKALRDLFSIDFVALTLPVFIKPSPVALIALLELLAWVSTRLDDIRYESHKARAKTTFSHQAEFDLFNANNLVLLHYFLVERQVVVQIALRFE